MTKRDRVNTLLAAATLGFLLMPGGVLNRRISVAWSGHRQRALIAEEWVTLVSEGGRLGNASSSAQMVEFMDYECPFCRISDHRLDSLLVARPDVSVLVRHLPLVRIHRNAELAALASICAEFQGSFAEAHHQLMAVAGWVEKADWRGMAAAAGVGDLDLFERCMGGQEAADRLSRDIEVARSLGAEATPTWVSPLGLSSRIPDPPTLN